MGEYIFNTKKDLRIFTKQMMQKLFNKEILGDHPFLFELIKRHPEPNEKYLNDISFFRAYPNPVTGDTSSPHVVLVRRNGSETPFSWNACVTGRRHGGPQLLNAMRSAISEDIVEFKFSQPQACMSCGSSGELDVDHVVSFAELAEKFLSEKTNHPTEFSKNYQSRDIFCKNDIEFESEWVEFHLKNSTLQLLCKLCHKLKTKESHSKTVRI